MMKSKNIILSFIVIILFSTAYNLYNCKSLFCTQCTKAESNEAIITYSPYHADAGIHMEENLYFKKYTITLHEGIGKIDYCYNRNSIDLVFDNGAVDNLTVNDKDIMHFLFAKKSSGDVILSIKTDYKENYVYNDLENPKKVVVLVSKKKNPYIAKVTLDPGHGGEDPGTNKKYRETTLYEKNITLDIALMCEPILRYNGINVSLTRRIDTYMPGCKTEKEDLKKRVAIANSSKSDLFISIHVNANPDPSCSGISIYYVGNQKKSERLANILNEDFKNKTPWQTNDLKTSNLYVLKNTKMPGVLIECGFLTNENDIRRLSDITELSKVSKNISGGISRFFKE